MKVDDGFNVGLYGLVDDCFNCFFIGFDVGFIDGSNVRLVGGFNEGFVNGLDVGFDRIVDGFFVNEYPKNQFYRIYIPQSLQCLHDFLFSVAFCETVRLLCINVFLHCY